MEKQFSGMQSQIQSLIMAFANMKEQTQFDSMAKTLYDSHILGKEATSAPSAPSISAPTITPTSMTTAKEATAHTFDIGVINPASQATDSSDSYVEEIIKRKKERNKPTTI